MKPPRICYACQAHKSKGIKCRECERPACIHLIGHVLRPDPQDSSTWTGCCHSRSCKDAVEARYLERVRSNVLEVSK